MVKKCGKPKWKVESPDHSNVKKKIAKALETNLRKAFKETDKKKRSTAISEIETKCKEMFLEDENVKENMRKVLTQIQDGTFAKEWITENDEGRPTFNRLREENAGHQIEEIGKELRGMMSFLSDAD